MTGNRTDAEDLAQDAFLQAFARLKDFRVGARFHPWLYTIALNLCRNHLRHKSILRWIPLQRKTREDDAAADVDPPSVGADPEQALLDAEGEERLQKAIQGL